MLTKKINHKTLLNINNSTEGETIEMKIERILTLKEPIKDGAPIVYTDRKDGVQPAYDIRTDRFEIAIEAMDKVTAATQAKRSEFYKPKEEPKVETKEESKEVGQA